MYQAGARNFVVPEKVALNCCDGALKQRVITTPAYSVNIPVARGSITKGLISRFKETNRVRVDDHEWIRKESLDITKSKILVVNVIRFTDSGDRSSIPFAVEHRLRFNDKGRMLTFDLAAVVYHIGLDADNGHYVAQVKKKGTWYLCDDESVRHRPPPDKSTKVTLLMYRLKK